MTERQDSPPGTAARELLIDRQLPQFQARTFNAVLVDASTERTYQAIRALDPDQVGQTVPFMQLIGTGTKDAYQGPGGAARTTFQVRNKVAGNACGRLGSGTTAGRTKGTSARAFLPWPG